MPPSAIAAGPHASQLEPERALRDRWPWPLVPGTASLLCWALAAGLSGQAPWRWVTLAMLLLGAAPGGLVGWAHRRAKPKRLDAIDSTWLADGRNKSAALPWLWLYRAALAVQGLTWVAACWWLWPGLEGAAPVLVITSLAMGVAGLATVGALDPLAGLIWGLPAATGLCVRAWLAAEGTVAGSPHAQAAWMLMAVAACALPLLAMQAWRATRVAQARVQQLQSLQDLLQLHWRSDQQLRMAEQVAQLGSFYWNPVTGNLHWSDQHCRLWGHVPGTVAPTYELFAQGVHPEDRPLLELQLQKSLRDGGHYERIHRVLWPDGTVREVHARGEVTLDDHGVAVRMIGTVQDITDRRAAEARLHAHEFVVNAIADPISVIDEHRVYSMVNDAWCRITGMARERVEHQPPRGCANLGRQCRTQRRLAALPAGRHHPAGAGEPAHAWPGCTLLGGDHLPVPRACLGWPAGIGQTPPRGDGDARCHRPAKRPGSPGRQPGQPQAHAQRHGRCHLCLRLTRSRRAAAFRQRPHAAHVEHSGRKSQSPDGLGRDGLRGALVGQP
jgi:PAS domain-containing protein